MDDRQTNRPSHPAIIILGYGLTTLATYVFALAAWQAYRSPGATTLEAIASAWTRFAPAILLAGGLIVVVGVDLLRARSRRLAHAVQRDPSMIDDPYLDLEDDIREISASVHGPRSANRDAASAETAERETVASR